MKRNILVLVAAALLLTAGAAFGANSIDVNNAAAMGPDNGGTACSGGNCGLEIIFDGSVNVAKVVDDTPADESLYRAEFYMNFDNLTMGDGTFFVAMRATDLDLFRSAFQILVTRKFNIFRLSGRAGTNNPAVFRITPRINISDGDGEILMRAEWEQSPAPATPGGEFTLTIVDCGGCASEGQSVNTTDFHGVGANNNSVGVDDLHAGAVGNIPGTNNGSMYFDEFASFRTLSAAP